MTSSIYNYRGRGTNGRALDGKKEISEEGRNIESGEIDRFFEWREKGNVREKRQHPRCDRGYPRVYIFGGINEKGKERRMVSCESLAAHRDGEQRSTSIRATE